jgi:hypothetical protein
MKTASIMSRISLNERRIEMKKTKELLFEDYERLDEISKIMDAKSDQRNDIEEMKDKIRNELIKYDSIEMESESKKNELEAQNKWEKCKNWILPFLWRKAKIPFFRFLGKMAFSRKGGIFRKGHFGGILGGGQK